MTAEDLRQRIADLMPVAHDELAELVALRSVADPRQYPAEECERTAQWVLEKFADVGFSDARLEQTADGSMAVVGERKCSHSGAPTVLLYAHYDVQPPLDDDAWRTPPFERSAVGAKDRLFATILDVSHLSDISTRSTCATSRIPS